MKQKIIKVSLLLMLVIGVSFLIRVNFSLAEVRLAVAPFEVEYGYGKEVIRCRSCGNIMESGPIEGDPASTLIYLLWEFIQEKGKGIELIPQGQVEGVYNTLLAKGIEKDPLILMKAIGLQIKADYVLWGTVFHYQERKGTAYGVQQPASIAMDLHLLKVQDGSLIWKAHWAQTQKSLSENLLEMKSFIRSKMRWVTVKELSSQGLMEMLKDFPSAETLR
ncbi:MAG: hypothetical protein ABSE95_11335 [Thermodesulfobacteriota bacterium]